MAVFFTDWDLWQEMTFVLACCIAIVFGIGFAKLWWSNRALRKLEVIDEEKRARVLEMRHCGIDAWAADDIPFGVRAIQSGIEVEGIWISRLYTPDFSRVASSATLVGEFSEAGKTKGLWPGRASGGFGRSRYASGSSTIDETLYADPLLPPGTPVLEALDYLVQSSDDAAPSPEQRPLQLEPQLSSYMPTGLHENRQRSETPETRPQNPLVVLSPGVEPVAVGGVRRPTGNSTPYGTAEVYANRDTRRTNRGFEVLPAGILGPRQEFSDPPGLTPDTNAGMPQPKRRNKLRKNPPLIQDRPHRTGSSS